MIHCTNCGAIAQPSHKFCSQCGTPINGNDLAGSDSNTAHVERVACPHCNELVWVNVPGGKKLERVTQGYWSSTGDSAKQSCPHCGCSFYAGYL